MADQERGFYLLILHPDGPSLVERACVVRGAGLERFGSEADVLGTLDAAAPAEAVAHDGQLHDLHGARVVRSIIRVDGVSADVVVLRPDGPLPPVTETEVRTWLAVALVASGLELTTHASHSFSMGGEGSSTSVSVGDLIGDDGHTSDWQRWLPAIGTLFLGLLLGVWLGFGAGGGESDVSVDGAAATKATTAPMKAPKTASATATARPRAIQARAPEARPKAKKVTAKRPRPTKPPPPKAAPRNAVAPEAHPDHDPDLGSEGDEGGEDSPDDVDASVALAPSPKAAPPEPKPVRTVAPPKSVDRAAPSAEKPTLKLASGAAALRPLPAVSLWNGGPTPKGVTARCNPYGDLALQVGSGRRAIKRVIVCGRFRPYGALGMMRSAVCIPSQRRCANTAEAAATNKHRARAARVRPRQLPAYVCTPISGRPYGLRRYGKKLRYRNGLAQLGMKTFGGVKLTSRCGRRAPYAVVLPRLKRTPVIPARGPRAKTSRAVRKRRPAQRRGAKRRPSPRRASKRRPSKRRPSSRRSKSVRRPKSRPKTKRPVARSARKPTVQKPVAARPAAPRPPVRRKRRPRPANSPEPLGPPEM